jgi:hypothetical protein
VDARPDPTEGLSLPQPTGVAEWVSCAIGASGKPRWRRPGGDRSLERLKTLPGSVCGVFGGSGDRRLLEAALRLVCEKGGVVAQATGSALIALSALR